MLPREGDVVALLASAESRAYAERIKTWLDVKTTAESRVEVIDRGARPALELPSGYDVWLLINGGLGHWLHPLFDAFREAVVVESQGTLGAIFATDEEPVGFVPCMERDDLLRVLDVHPTTAGLLHEGAVLFVRDVEFRGVNLAATADIEGTRSNEKYRELLDPKRLHKYGLDRTNLTIASSSELFLTRARFDGFSGSQRPRLGTGTRPETPWTAFSHWSGPTLATIIGPAPASTLNAIFSLRPSRIVLLVDASSAEALERSHRLRLLFGDRCDVRPFSRDPGNMRDAIGSALKGADLADVVVHVGAGDKLARFGLQRFAESKHIPVAFFDEFGATSWLQGHLSDQPAAEVPIPVRLFMSAEDAFEGEPVAGDENATTLLTELANRADLERFTNLRAASGALRHDGRQIVCGAATFVAPSEAIATLWATGGFWFEHMVRLHLAAIGLGVRNLKVRSSGAHGAEVDAVTQINQHVALWSCKANPEDATSLEGFATRGLATRLLGPKCLAIVAVPKCVTPPMGARLEAHGHWFVDDTWHLVDSRFLINASGLTALLERE